jgi:hypothetical protein
VGTSVLALTNSHTWKPATAYRKRLCFGINKSFGASANSNHGKTAEATHPLSIMRFGPLLRESANGCSGDFLGGFDGSTDRDWQPDTTSRARRGGGDDEH